MNLASPAPLVEPAEALPPEISERAIASRATCSEAAVADPPTPVDAAVANITSALSNRVSAPASVEALRARTTIDLETYAGILCDRPVRTLLQILLPCLYGGPVCVAYGEIKKYLVIMGATCFVYAEEHDPAPLYSFPLSEMEAYIDDPKHPHVDTYIVDPVSPNSRTNPKLRTVLLRHKYDGSYAYQITFNVDTSGKDVAETFVDIVARASKTYTQQRQLQNSIASRR
jgi:hypothetical protein